MTPRFQGRPKQLVFDTPADIVEGFLGHVFIIPKLGGFYFFPKKSKKKVDFQSKLEMLIPRKKVKDCKDLTLPKSSSGFLDETQAQPNIFVFLNIIYAPKKNEQRVGWVYPFKKNDGPSKGPPKGSGRNRLPVFHPGSRCKLAVRKQGRSLVLLGLIASQKKLPI